ncbi:MAG: circadian clock protein KaiC [Ramlibacter sp.]|nr:circadian clock protein KaiC [Ramlibacter sp.]
MSKPRKKGLAPKAGLQKCLTGIKGFDEITEGGLPRNRITLLAGSTGTGKTLLGVDFLISGVTQYKEPGVFMTFEENEDDLYKDVASLNMDLQALVAEKKIVLDYVLLERRDIQEAGEFNLEGIFVRLEHAIDSIKAKRVVMDSIESLFAGVHDTGILRLEIKRLFRWLKEKKVTTLITGEVQPDSFTRHGLEEYISDCIILVDNRVRDQIATRRLRVIKYRGSNHGVNEYPFVIDNDGLSVIPITSAGLDHPGSAERVSTGVASLDKLFKGGGYTRGSTILASGTAGTGKTSLAVAFAVETCKRGEKSLFVSYEESPGQLIENMKSIGFELGPLVRKGLLKIVATRPAFFGLEIHLLNLNKMVADFQPNAVVIDPLTSLLMHGNDLEVQSMLTRMIDALKSKGITGFFTSVVSSTEPSDASGDIGVSSLIDTWVVVRELEENEGKRRTRGIYVVKARGMGHSSDVHKLILSNDGMRLVPMDPDATAGDKQKKTIGKSTTKPKK